MGLAEIKIALQIGSALVSLINGISPDRPPAACYETATPERTACSPYCIGSEMTFTERWIAGRMERSTDPEAWNPQVRWVADKPYCDQVSEYELKNIVESIYLAYGGIQSRDYICQGIVKSHEQASRPNPHDWDPTLKPMKGPRKEAGGIY